MRVPFLHFPQSSATFDTCIGISLSMMPPCIVARVGFWCFFTMFMPSTITRSDSGITREIVPVLPTSLPARTNTSSPLRSFIVPSSSQHLGRERHDAHELAIAQLAADGAEDACAAGLHLVVDEHRSVLVEPDVAPIRPALFLLRTD